MQIAVRDETYEQLRTAARGGRRSMASVVREALSEWLERRADDAQDHDRRVQRAPAAIGGFHSGLGDLAENHDTYFAAGDLVSVAEIAQRLGRPVSTVQTWRKRYETFPTPLVALAAGPVWDWDQVERWTRRHESGETRRRRSRRLDRFPEDLPGADLVANGLDDLASRRLTIEAALVSMATTRLRELGVEVEGPPVPDASDRLYELVERRVGEAGAHSRYNALRRRLSSFLRALAAANA